MLITLSEIINFYKICATFFKDTKSYPSQWKKDLNCGGFTRKSELLLNLIKEYSTNDKFEIPVPISVLSNSTLWSFNEWDRKIKV